MTTIQILWVDDEIDLLKPHILFLERKNYEVTRCTNGADAINLVDHKNFDIVFLDENMPGLSGLATLSEIKQKQPNLADCNDYKKRRRIYYGGGDWL